MESSRNPFQGLTFCSTALSAEVAKDITKKIIKLGGKYSGDLTLFTNVLVINHNSTNLLESNKYDFVTKHRNDIVIINDSTINELYAIWVNGDDITCKTHSNYSQYKDNDPLRMLHVLQTRYFPHQMEKFYIFIGRCKDYKDTKELEMICDKFGCYGYNSENFIRDAPTRYSEQEVIFISDNFSSQRAIAASATEGMHIVHYKWLLDCYKRCAVIPYDPHYLLQNCLDSKYDDIGKEACDNIVPDLKLKYLTSQDHIDSNADDTTVIHTIKPKLNTKINKLWEKTFDSKKETDEVIHEKSETDTPTEHSVETDISSSSNGIFADCSFAIHRSFDTRKSDILEKIITTNDGKIMRSTRRADYLIIPSNLALDSLNLDPNLDTMPELVTEFFIERCLHYKKLIVPLDSWSKPFLYTADFKLVPPRGFLHNHSDPVLNIAITGFYGVELLQLKKILEILKQNGIHFSEYLNSKTDILLVNISSLTSIPRTHNLWNNEYGDLLAENHKQFENFNDNQKDIQMSPVFRNSMKEKILFAKSKHPIPISTPAFIMDIFHTARVFTRNIPKEGEEDDGPRIGIKDNRWTVYIPRGHTDNFICKLKYVDPAPSSRQIEPKREYHIQNHHHHHHSSEKVRKIVKREHSASRPSSSNFASVKAMAREVIDTMNSPFNSLASSAPDKQRPPIRKRVQPLEEAYQNSITPVTPLKHQELSPPVIKRPKLAMAQKNLKPVQREVSWGSMISDELKRNGQRTLKIDEIQIRETFNENNKIDDKTEGTYTQVTYGRRDNTEVQSKPTSKRMTRHHAKELGI
ncbi:hypothetical protein C6P45_005122 [Maudiozyma exigua]|uniref:BRCT domain-containing protein n=1 Tax=Maudiozyma exigua TaxID=34358 RepID=A0A9P6W9M8_MAUEX|nr:hypothetical protein C6P45_005122 [Kazachstania exigua]